MNAYKTRKLPYNNETETRQTIYVRDTVSYGQFETSNSSDTGDVYQLVMDFGEGLVGEDKTVYQHMVQREIHFKYPITDEALAQRLGLTHTQVSNRTRKFRKQLRALWTGCETS